AGKALDKGKTSVAVYIVEGYNDSIAYKFSESAKNMSFYMCDDLANPKYEFEAYKASTEVDIPVGTKVQVIGNIYHYYKAATEDRQEVEIIEIGGGKAILVNSEAIGGTCGDNLTWNLTNDTLTISGTGSMIDYSYGTAPWYSYQNSILSVVIESGVTSIGDFAFHECSALTSVTILSSVSIIGRWAFPGCTSLVAITNYATVPQEISSDVFYGVDKSVCTLYVPVESVNLYKAADVWKEFINIVGVEVPEEEPELETIEGTYMIYYVDKDGQNLTDEVLTLHVPVAPIISGFTFIGWQASGMLEEGITLQAIYSADEPSTVPAVYTNPANPAQKLIKNGNVYILTDDKTYTVTGQEVR
ncbi:MAG: leucine-rich repeat protein, partial [Paludibacteraceae bacterium]|nr:leucine-rich repeat protein [Paludibacteraceae bacterium]